MIGLYMAAAWIWFYGSVAHLESATIGFALCTGIGFGLAAYASAGRTWTRWGFLLVSSLIVLLLLSFVSYLNHFQVLPTLASLSLIDQAPSVLRHAVGAVPLSGFLLIAIGLVVVLGYWRFATQAPAGRRGLILLVMAVGLWWLPTLGVRSWEVWRHGGGGHPLRSNRVEVAFYFNSRTGLATYGVLQYLSYQRRVAAMIDVQEPAANPNPPKAIVETTDAERPNILMIQVESLNGNLVGLRFGDKEVTPFLNTLIANGAFYFPNFFAIHGAGGTSDAEIASLTGIAPLVEIPTMSLAPLGHLPAVPKVLNEYGYTCVAMHANTGAYWNRQSAYAQLGFEAFLDAEAYTGEAKGFGSDDLAFFQQSIEHLRELAERPGPFFAYMITQMSHDPWRGKNVGADHQFGLPDGNLNSYMQLIHYVDAAIAGFLVNLQRLGFLENTVVIIQGDHTTWYETPYYRTGENKLGERVPLLIYSPAHTGEILPTLGSHLDLAPSLLHLAGVPPDPRHAGRSLLRQPPDRPFPLLQRNQYFVATPDGLKDIENTPPINAQLRDYYRSYFLNIDSGPTPWSLTNVTFIAHALGQVGGVTYTNSREAFLTSYRRGFRVFEVDLLPTGDNHLVCLHDNLEERLGVARPLTELQLSELQQQKLDGRWPVMTLRELLELLREHEDAYLITDVKEDNVRWLTRLSEMDLEADLRRRIIPQIYHPDQLEALQSQAAFPAYILTGYRYQLEPQKAADFVLEHAGEVIGLTLPPDALRAIDPATIRALHDAGVALMVHTLNDKNRIYQSFQEGATGVYTDGLWDDDLLAAAAQKSAAGGAGAK